MQAATDPLDKLTPSSALDDVMEATLPLRFASEPSYRRLFESLPQTAYDLDVASFSHGGETQLNILQSLYETLRNPNPQGPGPSSNEAAEELVRFALANHDTYVSITLLMEMLINAQTSNLHEAARAKVFEVRGIAQEAMNDLIPVSPNIVEQLPSLEENVALRTASNSLLNRRCSPEHLHIPFRRLIELGGDLARPIIVEALRINPCRRFQQEMFVMIADPKEKLEIAREVYKRSRDMRLTDPNWNALLEHLEKG